MIGRLSSWFGAPPVLTPARMGFAFVVAVVTDALQILLGPLGWTFADEILDVIAMALVSRAIGFHMLLLPTFAIEILPVIDLIPTWTGCTAAVVILRRKAAQNGPSQPHQTRPPDLPPLIGN